MICSECSGWPSENGSIHGDRCRYNSGFPICGAHLCSICDRDRIMGNVRATGNVSGNGESGGNPVTSDQEPAT